MSGSGLYASPEHLQVLSIEDDPDFSELAQHLLVAEGFAVTLVRVQSLAAVDAALERQSWSVVLADHSMPGFSSIEALRAIRGKSLDLPFIIVSGHIGEEAAVAAMREGANDYVPKSSLSRLGIAVRSALTSAAERSALAQRERELQALYDIAFAAGRALETNRLATYAAERTRALLHVDCAALFWFEPGLRVLRCLAWSGIRPEQGGVDVVPGQGLVGQAFARRDTVSVTDHAQPSAELFDRAGGGSAVAVPLYVGERVVGAMLAGALRLRRFAPEEERLLAVLGSQVAPALEASRLLADAQHLARYDALTGLPNRMFFTARVRQRIAEAAEVGNGFALLYADLDDFREINDAFGYDAGNDVLRQLAQRLSRAARLDDVARLGADEFGVLLRLGSTESDGCRVAARALEFLREPFFAREQPVHLAASIGVVVAPDQGRTEEELLRNGEAAMYAAKQAQTRYVVYGPQIPRSSQQRIEMMADLRRALAAGEMVLHYQPQVDIASGQLVGTEALLRWNHPTRGLVPPLEFIPLAEESGLIVEFTPWVIEEALRQTRAWNAAGLDLRISVNVAMRNLRDPAFLEVVAALVHASGVPPKVLTLEITEGTTMLEPQRTLQVLGQIREVGIAVAVDDFGTGYSSLGYLSRLPVDELKIDKSFVMELQRNGNRAIVRAVVELASAFDLRVVAEGVKDATTWDAVAALGCNLAQGYYLSPALPPQPLAAWARARQRQP
jgi:diguanylate cyclase (GGDEF)-like protein